MNILIAFVTKIVILLTLIFYHSQGKRKPLFAISRIVYRMPTFVNYKYDIVQLDLQSYS